MMASQSFQLIRLQHIITLRLENVSSIYHDVAIIQWITSLEIITLGLCLSPAVSTRDPIIKPESISSRADNGRGLILRAMTKVPCYNLFITYSKTFFFRIILIKNTNQSRTNGPINAHLTIAQ